jgi:hypothetical protein
MFPNHLRSPEMSFATLSVNGNFSTSKKREAELLPATKAGQTFCLYRRTALGIASMQPGYLVPTLPVTPFATLGDDTRFYDLDGLEPWKISVENSIRP